MTEDHRDLVDDRDDPVVTLIRLAGRPRAVAPERMERAREAARAQWRVEVRRRSRRRALPVLVGVAAAASLAIAGMLWLAARPDEAGLLVEAASGPASVDGRTVQVGDTVMGGARLATGTGGRLVLQLPSGHSVRLRAASAIRWVRGNVLALDRGAIYVDSGFGRQTRDEVEVRTALGSFHEVGTQFELRTQADAVYLRVREGAVLFRHEQDVQRVEVGTELVVRRDGELTRRAVPIFGAEWAWVEDAVTMPDFEGRSARAFLDWAAREGGWRLGFADERVADAAEEIVLRGSFEKLTLQQALDAVLPTCRLTYRIDEGVLMVDIEPSSLPRDR